MPSVRRRSAHDQPAAYLTGPPVPLLSSSSVEIRDDLRDGINRALNEADLLGVSVADDGSEATIVVRVLTLPADGPEPEDRVRCLRCRPIARVAASLRHGLWNDETARVEPLTLDQFSGVVASRVSQVYGWKFLDPPESSWEGWRKRLSLDVRLGDRSEHVLDMFKAGLTDPERHLDFRIWFDELEVFDQAGAPISLQDFADGGTRWWDGLYAGDPRTQGHGIGPLRATGDAPPK